MTDANEIARRLTKGAARACLLATDNWQFPGKATFDANGIWALHNAKGAGGRGALVEREIRDDRRSRRYAYRLTMLGLAVKRALEQGEVG